MVIITNKKIQQPYEWPWIMINHLKMDRNLPCNQTTAADLLTAEANRKISFGTWSPCTIDSFTCPPLVAWRPWVEQLLGAPMHQPGGPTGTHEHDWDITPTSNHHGEQTAGASWLQLVIDEKLRMSPNTGWIIVEKSTKDLLVDS